MAYALAHPDRAPTRRRLRDPARLTRKLHALRETLDVTGPPGGGLRRGLPGVRRTGDPRGLLVHDRAAAQAAGGLRGRAGRAARRVARLPPVHHLEHDDLRQRAGPCSTGSAARTARRAAHLHHPARARSAGHRGSDARGGRGRTTGPALAGPVPRRVTSTRWPTATRWRSPAGPTRSRSPTWTRRCRGCASPTTSASFPWARRATSTGRPRLTDRLADGPAPLCRRRRRLARGRDRGPGSPGVPGLLGTDRRGQGPYSVV